MLGSPSPALHFHPAVPGNSARQGERQREISTCHFSAAHQAKADSVEDVEPVPTPPRERREVASQEGVISNHGFSERLFGLLFPAEVCFHLGRRIALCA